MTQTAGCLTYSDKGGHGERLRMKSEATRIVCASNFVAASLLFSHRRAIGK